MNSHLSLACFVSLLLVLSTAAAAEEDESASASAAGTSGAPGRMAVLVGLNGPIGPATADFVTKSLASATQMNAEVVILLLDTPGGLDTSTRDIVQAILNSTTPVATFVAPEGARAASAGTFILYASHVAAMSPATNVGAATPVAIIGGEPPRQDKPSAPDGEREPAATSPDAMSRKAINDAVAYARGLAAKHGRNADWVESAVRDAASIPASEALELGVIDLIASDVNDLLAKMDGREVNAHGQTRILKTASLPVHKLEPDWKTKLLSVITSPTVAYVLFMIGIYGLILEGYNPGGIVPGVVGAISLLLALYAFQMLPVNYAGVALIALGVLLIIAEALAPSFGALGIGGVVSMVIGSIILIDSDAPGFMVSRPLIGALALVSALGLMGIIMVAMKARKRPVVTGWEELVGATGIALADFDGEGFVLIHGERWQAVSGTDLNEGQAVRVTGIDGLTLFVEARDG